MKIALEFVEFPQPQRCPYRSKKWMYGKNLVQGKLLQNYLVDPVNYLVDPVNYLVDHVNYLVDHVKDLLFTSYLFISQMF